MKLILTLAFAYFFTSGIAQTPLIAHKSHSGSSVDFFIDPSGNFGNIEMPENFQLQIPITYKNFKPLNDSVMILEVTDEYEKVIKVDILPNQNRYSPFVFEFRYKDSIRKKELEDLNLKIEQVEQELKPEQIQSQQEVNPIPPKKKKKSYLLFLFGITGGGMLLIKLFGKSKVSHPSIA